MIDYTKVSDQQLANYNNELTWCVSNFTDIPLEEALQKVKAEIKRRKADKFMYLNHDVNDFLNSLKNVIMTVTSNQTLNSFSDDGSYNFDSVMIPFSEISSKKRIPKKGIIEFLEEKLDETGVAITTNATSKYLIITPPKNCGNCNKRTEFARKMSDLLKLVGYNSSVYYQLD